MEDPTAPVLGVSDVMLGVVACTLAAKKNTEVNASAWLNFQLRIRIKPTSQG